MLDRYRKEIDAIDDQIAALLEQRFAITATIGQLKATSNQPIKNGNREKAVVNRLGLGRSILLKTTYTKIYHIIFNASRKQQKIIAKHKK